MFLRHVWGCTGKAYETTTILIETFLPCCSAVEIQQVSTEHLRHAIPGCRDQLILDGYAL